MNILPILYTFKGAEEAMHVSHLCRAGHAYPETKADMLSPLEWLVEKEAAEPSGAGSHLP